MEEIKNYRYGECCANCIYCCGTVDSIGKKYSYKKWCKKYSRITFYDMICNSFKTFIED